VWTEENISGRRTWGVARMTYWIGADGRIKKIYKKVDPARHADEILADLQSAREKK
jgi:peroxiredoxin Q/BCP